MRKCGLSGGRDALELADLRVVFVDALVVLFELQAILGQELQDLHQLHLQSIAVEQVAAVELDAQ
jgi:hypothetical protein